MASTSSKRASSPTMPSPARIARCMRIRTIRLSGDVGKQRVLDPGDQIFELELPLLEAGKLELITSRRGGHGADRGIQVAMLLAKLYELGFQSLFFFVGHRRTARGLSRKSPLLKSF